MKKEKTTPIPLIRLSWVKKILDKKEILCWVDISVEAGTIFGFLWPNGAGKTTTMKCILWLLIPDEGSIEILWSSELTREVRSKIGFMPENTYLYKYLTGKEFLEFNGKFFKIPKAELAQKIDELLEKVWLSHAKNTLLAKYSKGMLQRIGLAQSIINSPTVVFLDEPMSWLDPVGRKMVKDLILELREKGTTVFFNTHILSDVESICDNFAIIHHGSIIANQAVKDLAIPLETFFMEKITNTEKGIGIVI